MASDEKMTVPAPEPPALPPRTTPADGGPLTPLPEDWERALAVVAHPDDAEYGIACAAARWTSEGKHVAYLLATRGEAGIDALSPRECARVREAEERAGASLVGVKAVDFLDHPDGTIEYGLPLRRDITAAIRRQRPELVLTINHRDTFGGSTLNMADHRHVGCALLDAVRDAANRWTFPDTGKPWSGVRMAAVNASPSPTHAVDITGFLDRGIASLCAHRRYLEHIGQTPEEVDTMLRDFSTAAGQRLGVRHATAFEVFDF